MARLEAMGPRKKGPRRKPDLTDVFTVLVVLLCLALFVLGAQSYTYQPPTWHPAHPQRHTTGWYVGGGDLP